MYEMRTQNIVNLLNDTDNESSKFATKKWYVIHDQNGVDYGERNENGISIKFETKNIKSSLFNYLDAYVLVTGDIAVTDIDADTNVAFKNCAPFTICVTHINDEQIDTAENPNIAMPVYTLIEYSEIYSNTFGSIMAIQKRWISYKQ